MEDPAAEKNVNEENQTTAKRPGEDAPMRGFWAETLRFTFIAALIILPIRFFVAQPFVVSGDSMVPTFEDGEYLIVDEISYRFQKPARGDVVIFRYPRDRKKFFIKRIIGLPGETVAMVNDRILITAQSGATKELDEPYTRQKRDDRLTVKLKDGEYFVLGDNRAASSDSRVWGTLPAGNIVGRPIVRLFPISRLDLLPGRYVFSSSK